MEPECICGHGAYAHIWDSYGPYCARCREELPRTYKHALMEAESYWRAPARATAAEED